MLLILDFGGAQSQFVARRIRGENIYCEVLGYQATAAQIAAKAPRGIVLVGGTQDAWPDDAPDCAQEIYDLGLPMLGIGYGARIAVKHFGGKLFGPVLEKKPAHIAFDETPLFAGLSECDRFLERADAWELPEGFFSAARGGGTDAAYICPERSLYGMQFYPESNDPDGLRILSNFADICGCERQWSVQSFIEEQIAAIRARVGEGHALIAISGGVDSSVCAALMSRAIGHNMHCVHVDTGLMRKDESAMIARVFQEMDIHLITVDAQERFLGRLRGVTDPEEKRRVIDEEFLNVFEEEAQKLGKVDFLVQGTIYPDVLGSAAEGVVNNRYAGDMPVKMRFGGLIEPLRELFKDEVRQVGTALGLPPEMVHRQPFPGPGLAVRCMGEVTGAKLAILREADAIFREEVANAGLERKIWQYFVVLTDMRTAGTRDGVRTWEYTVALRAIHSVDAMTATAVRLPYDLLERCVDRITTHVPGVGRVVYDVTGKPTATIEWE